MRTSCATVKHRHRGSITASLLLALVPLTSAALASQALTTAEARNHIGETATVCGKVASAHFAARSRGQPTFINLDKPYPNQVFTVLIWGSDRGKLGAPEMVYQDRDICVTGRIREPRRSSLPTRSRSRLQGDRANDERKQVTFTLRYYETRSELAGIGSRGGVAGYCSHEAFQWPCASLYRVCVSRSTSPETGPFSGRFLN